MINTNKVMFVGDLHLDSSTPSSRVDDYSDASIEKLYNLKNVCLIKEIKMVVLLGDVFNKHDQSNQYLNRILKVFKDFKELNISVYSIVGNHDLSFERIDTLERSPLQMLFTSGLIKHLTSETIDTGAYTVNIYGLDYPDNPVPVSELPDHSSKLNVLCTHRFYNYAFNDPHSLSTEDCVSLGYNIYAMGHDHIQYDVEKTQSFWVVRPGSFMRTSSHNYNLSRPIAVDIIEFVGTEEMPKAIAIREIVKSKPASEVFSVAVFNKESEHDLNQELSDLQTRVGNMLNMMDLRHTSQDVFAVLDVICEDPEVKSCIELYLSLKGYKRG